MFEGKPTRYNREGFHKPLKNPIEQKTIENMRKYRLQRVREQLKAKDCAAIVLFDPINIRYATDISNMQVWILHNPSRFAIINTEGPTMAYEYRTTKFLAEGLVDEVHYASSWFYFAAGSRVKEKAQIWAREVFDAVKQYSGKNKRIAIDNCNPEGAHFLQKLGVEIVNGQEIMEQARFIKSKDELVIVDWTMKVCNQAMWRMHHNCYEGKTENEIWAELHYENIRNGGEWIETRLLASGPRTNPWMQECSDRIVQDGEMLSFDTDMIGPYGYCVDVSRAWTIGHKNPSEEQRNLYRLAYEQIHYNMELIKPGVTFSEFSEKSWKVPDEYYKNRYSTLAHGVGLCDEYPTIAFPKDFAKSGYDGMFLPNSTICVESYIGKEGGKQGVKLETQILVTDNGYKRLDDFYLNEEWL